MDTLIGDLLQSMPQETIDNTYIIFVGDNGTAMWDQPPSPRDPRRVKMTVYEGGVAVPLIIAGPKVDAGQVRRPLAHAVDLFSTIIELAGGTVRKAVPENITIDSVSIMPYLFGANVESKRDWVLTEITFNRLPARAIRNERYKLILQRDREELYDLESDPNELNALDLASLSGTGLESYITLSAKLNELQEP